MAWEKYNTKYEPINGKRLRFAGWEHATKLSGKSIEADTITYNGVSIEFRDVKYIRSEFTNYQVRDHTVVVTNVPGYGNYSMPKPLIEVWIDDVAKPKVVHKHKGINYSDNITHQRCSADTLLVPGDKVFLVTRTTLRDEYKCYISVSQHQDVSGLNKPFKLSTGKIITTLGDNHHKKMRKGSYIHSIPTKGRIELTGVDNARILVPIEYLEVRFGRATLEQRQQKYDISKTDNPIEKTTKSTVPTDSKKEKPKMELQFNAKQILEQNKDAFLIAAKIEVGEVAVQQVTKIVKKQLPLMMKGYAELPIFEIVLANMVVMAIKQFCPENEKAQIIADAMLMASMQKQIKEFNIPKMVEEFTSGIDISSITKLSQKEAE